MEVERWDWQGSRPLITRVLKTRSQHVEKVYVACGNPESTDAIQAAAG